MNKKMIQKSLVGILMVAIAIPIFYYGSYPLNILMAIVSVLVGYEMVHIIEQKEHWLLSLFLAIGIFLVGICPTNQAILILVCILLVLMICALGMEWFGIDHAAIVFLIAFIVGLAMRALHYIYSIGLGGLTALFVAIACYVCDTAAYFFGTFMGKHKMIPRVSPNKTWEGAIGGYVSGAILAMVFGFVFCKSLGQSLIIVSSLILPAIAEIGDLSFSLIKRHYGVKDYGSLLPGHGGVLDRIDSLLFCLLVFYALLLMWGF